MTPVSSGNQNKTHKPLKTKKIALIISASLVTAASQADTITYDWTETGSSFGNGTGTVVIEKDSTTLDAVGHSLTGQGYDFNVISATGTFNDTPITSGSGFFNFPTNTAPAIPKSSDFLSFYFTIVADNQYNIGTEYYPLIGISSPGGGYDNEAGSFTLTPAPEPATLALTTVGGLLGGFRLFRRNRK